MENITGAIKIHQDAFGLKLNAGDVERLAAYYDLVLDANPILHLVAPSTAEEFAIRHLLESLALLNYLPNGSRFADVGTGAGLPSIPCLLVRESITARLIESKEKKCRFLSEAAEKLVLNDRLEIVNRQFEETNPGNAEIVTCRALDKFQAKLPKLIKWANGRKLILFGGPALEEKLQELEVSYVPKLIPLSEQRYIFETV